MMKRTASSRVGKPDAAKPLLDTKNATQRNVLTLFTRTVISVRPLLPNWHRTSTPLINVNGFRPTQFLVQVQKTIQ
jgi:hypothetical protein